MFYNVRSNIKLNYPPFSQICISIDTIVTSYSFEKINAMCKEMSKYARSKEQSKKKVRKF